MAAPLPAAPRGRSAAGPVAQWLEPAAHNGLVGGSSPPGPTISLLDYSDANFCRSRYIVEQHGGAAFLPAHQLRFLKPFWGRCILFTSNGSYRTLDLRPTTSEKAL